MEPAVRSPRTESAIITDRAQNGGFGLPRLPYSRLPKGIGRGNPGAGNGIFGCRDGRLKIGLRDRKYHQRPKERNDTGENPHRNGLFGADPEICGLEGLDGGVRSQMRTGLDPELPDKCLFTGYFCELSPVIETCTRIRYVDSMACKQIP